MASIIPRPFASISSKRLATAPSWTVGVACLEYRRGRSCSRWMSTQQKSARRRTMHTIPAPSITSSSASTTSAPPISHSPGGQLPGKAAPPLSILPLGDLLRSYIITAFSSFPAFLGPSLRLLSFLAHSKSIIFNPDRNRLLHYILKRTFYAQFCAGECMQEVHQTVQRLKNMGYKGVILTYGKEIVIDKKSGKAGLIIPHAEALSNITSWKQSLLATIALTGSDDFVAVKFSGAGPSVMRELLEYSPTESPLPSADLAAAISEICESAKDRNVRLMFDAEQDAVQAGLDAWTIDLQRRYNNSSNPRALIYGTYQAYLQRAPVTVAAHLAQAQQDNFTLGVKLVRGAYMGSDPRNLFWPSKEATDKAYDAIVDGLLHKQYNDILTQSSAAKSSKFPAINIDLCLASHNEPSTTKAIATHKATGSKAEITYGQLMGMADELSCQLVQDSVNAVDGLGPKAYKYLPWGSVGECLKYLVRRAEENRDAVSRARGTRKALMGEILRRVRA